MKRSARQHTSSRLALTALVIYIAGELVFRYSVLLSTYANLVTHFPLFLVECIAMAIAILAVIMRPVPLTLWQMLLTGTCFALLFLSASRTGDYRLVHGYILVVALSGVKRRDLLSAYGTIVLVIVVVLMTMSVTGLLYNKDVIPNSRLVFSYGFTHPNGLGAYLFAGVGAIAIAHQNSRSWRYYLVVTLAAAAFSYLLLSSHAASFCLLALAFALVIGHITNISRGNKDRSLPLFVLLVAIPLILIMVMLVGTVYYDAQNQILSQLNSWLHGRLHFANAYLVDNDGLTLFGRKYVSPGSSYHSGLAFYDVDSGYCKLGLIYGLLALCALYATYVIAAWRFSRGSSRFLVLALVIICSLYLMVEGYQLYLATGFGMLLLSEAFSPSSNLPVGNGD